MIAISRNVARNLNKSAKNKRAKIKEFEWWQFGEEEFLKLKNKRGRKKQYIIESDSQRGRRERFIEEAKKATKRRLREEENHD